MGNDSVQKGPLLDTATVGIDVCLCSDSSLGYVGYPLNFVRPGTPSYMMELTSGGDCSNLGTLRLKMISIASRLLI